MKIVVGHAKSAEGEAALEHAIEEARLRGAELIVARHLDVAGDEARAAAINPARHELHEAVERVTARGVTARGEVLTGQARSGDELVRFADEEGADLIVIGIRRRSPVGKLVLGSRAQDILLRSNCPVLAVKSDAPAED